MFINIIIVPIEDQEFSLNVFLHVKCNKNYRSEKVSNLGIVVRIFWPQISRKMTIIKPRNEKQCS